MAIKEEIVKSIKDSIGVLQKQKKLPRFRIPEILIKYPEQKAHGDCAANVALEIAKIAGKNPIEIAKLIESEIQKQELKSFEKIEIAKPGFINFFFSKEYLQQGIKNILKKEEKFGNLKIGRNKKIQVEFISANPTGPLTVGNARGGPFGDVLGNILRKAGFKVEKAYYINDCGMQILTLGHSVLKDKEAKYKGDYIDCLHKKNKEKDPYKAGEKAAEIIVEEMIKKTTKRMGIEYDEWFSEKSLRKSGEIDKVIKILKKKGLIYEKDEAWWFKSSKYGDERDRVVIKADGGKTYLIGDIAYHRYKFEKKKFNKAINIWGADHYGDIVGLQAGIEALNHKGKLDIILLQFVTLFEKDRELKMSKRRGTYVAMDELLDELSPDIVRFFFLQKSADTHLKFDLSLAKEQSEKNPVYYIQYAYARICSILKKVEDSTSARASAGKKNLELLGHPSELNLIKQLIKLPEIIENTTKDYQIQRLPQYAYSLAEAFHQFYGNCKVITEDKKLKEARLALILATKIVLKETLNLMGISSPEKM